MILITGSAIDPYRVAAAKRGVRYLFDKATDIPQLLETLEALAAARTDSTPAV